MSTPLHEQLALFDLGLNLSAIRQSKEKRLLQKNRSVNTINAYAHSWGVFEKWCREEAGRESLPAAADTVELFVEWSIETKGYRLDTIRLTLAAIRDKHRSAKLLSPVSSQARELIANAARAPDYEEQQKEALTFEQLKKICRGLGRETQDVRDHAALVLGFASGFRRSELVGLNYRDVSFDGATGDLLLRLRRSKGDQVGEGRTVRIERGQHLLTCPVRQLQNWLAVRGDWAGPLFCKVRYDRIHRSAIAGRVICEAVQHGLRKIGGVRASDYGAHSLRAGFVTAAADNGASELAIRARTGHKTIGMLARYVRDRNGMRVNPLKGVL